MRLASRVLGIWCRQKAMIATFSGCLLLVMFCFAFVHPIRNVMFSPFIYYAWQEMDTSDLLRLYYAGNDIPDGIFSKVSCHTIRFPKVVKNDVNASAIFSYPHLKKPEMILKVLRNGHGSFLPALSHAQKLDYMYLYLVLAEALNDVGVKHFLIDGPLLGLIRHGGIIPWDDDLDIAMNINTWELVRQTLSCIHGFTLMKENAFHWKFHHRDSKFPFVDIFFYDMDEKYVWALTHYARITFIYPTKYVFPLTDVVFEGIKMPVPADSLTIVRRIYTFDICQAYKGHKDLRNTTLLKNFPDGYSVTRVECEDLAYMYSMHHLRRT